MVIFADGNTLAKRLVDDRVIKDVFYPQFKSINNINDVEDYLIESRRHDGAFFYNGCENSIARVNWVNDEPDGTAEIAARYNHISSRRHLFVPPDFVCAGAQDLSLKDLEDSVGRRTGLAIVVPYVYSLDGSPVQAYQIKQSAWGRLGMGTVNQYGPDGLSRRFLLRYEPNGEGPFIDLEHGITGYDQQLRWCDGRVRVVEEQKVCSEMYSGGHK